MTAFTSGKRSPSSIYFIILFLPFFLFYWMIPFVSDLTIGNDYQRYSIENQMELFFSIRNGSFPLYVPGYSLGQSASALTLGQLFHPISHAASLMPGYWGGKALQWYTVLKLLSLGVTQLALFVFLRKLKVTALFSFLLSLIAVYNLRMLDSFRYGAALEAYTGHLLLCAFIGSYFLNEKKWYMPLLIICATYWLVCSGHPQMMYLGLLGSVLFLLVVPFFISSMLPERRMNLKDISKSWIKVGLYLITGVLLSSAYIFPFYFDFITTNAERVAQGYQSSLSYEIFLGTINNFFMPFFSEIHGAFGGSSLFIMAALMPVLLLFKIKIPRPVWAVWGLLLFAFLYMQGARTPLHKLVWETLPFASSFRGEGRISIFIPMFIMMILAWIVNAGSFSIRFRTLSVSLTPCKVLASLSAAVMICYLPLFFSAGHEHAQFIPYFIRDIPAWIIVIVSLSGVFSLWALIIYGSSRYDRLAGSVLCLLVLIQVGTILRYGTFVTEWHDMPTLEQMKSEKRTKLVYRHNPGTGMSTSAAFNQLNNSFVEPYLGKIFTHVSHVSSTEEAYEKMRRERLPQQIFVEGYAPETASAIAIHGADAAEGTVDLVYSSFNRLQFRVVSSVPAFFGMSYPFTGHWGAWLNGQETRIYPANGAAHAVEIPEGESLIEFRYWSPAAFWGMVISCIVFIVVGFYFSATRSNGIRRVLFVLSVVVIGAAGFILWYKSLYTGDNLNTRYSWTYTPPSMNPNIAYGKRTFGFKRKGGFMFDHSSKAVDGDIDSGSGFTLPFDKACTVDLYHGEEINMIVLYGNLESEPEISLSQNGVEWERVASAFSGKSHDTPLRVLIKKPIIARFIRVKAVNSALMIDELQVHGPKPVR